MADLKAIRRRIGSVRSTQKITKAMEMVAAAKLRRAQDELFAIRPYTAKMQELLAGIAQGGGDLPAQLVPRPCHRALLVTITSDRGLCGGFNANAIAQAHLAFTTEAADGARVELVPIGAKAKELLKRNPLPVARTFELPDPPTLDAARTLAAHFLELHGQGQVDRVLLVFNRFVSTGVQEPVTEQLLPVPALLPDPAAVDGAPPRAADGGERRFEPDPATLLAELVPMSIEARLLWALRESRAAEQAARMAAMQGANRNAEQMIDTLTLEYNKARQAAITTELMEIVAGAEAQH